MSQVTLIQVLVAPTIATCTNITKLIVGYHLELYVAKVL